LTPYNFAQTSGTYTAITGGTVLGNTSNDENVFGTYSIGFTFTFNGTAFTQFSVATNGFIGLGSTTVTTSGTPLTGTSNNVIAALGVDLQGQTGSEIQYKLSGSSPNRTLVVQWTNYRKKSATGDVFNFQIRLNESGNSIQLVYNNFTVNGTSSTPQVGLRGASSAEYNDRMVDAVFTTWAASGYGTLNSSNCRLRSTVKPASGQTYTWSTCSAQSIPFTEDFDGVTTPATPDCWTVTNNNSDAYQWQTSTTFPNSAPNSMYIRYNTSTAMNDWFYTPGLSLTGGHTYRVEFYYMGDGSTTYAEKLEVKWGASPSAAGMTSSAIFTNASISVSGYTLGAGSFSPAATGVYYVGWHGYSPADQNIILVDDISIVEQFTNDVGSVALINPSQIPATQLMPWFGEVRNFGTATQTFTASTKLRENSALSSTANNTVTSLTSGSLSALNGNFNLSALGTGSTFDLSLQTNLSGDQVPANDLYTNYTRPCTRGTVYAWDDGTAEGTIGFNTGSGWVGQLFYLSSPASVSSCRINWGTIPGALTGVSIEIYDVSGGIPSTKLADIATGINLSTTDQGTWVSYDTPLPIALASGTYWIGVHQSVALSGTYIVSGDQSGFTSQNFLPGHCFYSGDATTWVDYATEGINMFNLIRPDFALVGVVNPSNFTATPVSVSEVDLGWNLNVAGNNALVAWSTDGNFGTPANGTTYSAGNLISGGGTVLQYNNSVTYHHTSLSPGTTCYYKIWSYDGSAYSSGISASAITPCNATIAPITENFEEGIFPPSCWPLPTGSPTWFETSAASGYGTGSYSAVAEFFTIPATSGSFDLITLQFNASSMPSPTLKFDYAYATYATEVDSLDIYYSTDNGATYTALLKMPGGVSGVLNTAGITTVEFVPTAGQWATRSLSLPSTANRVKFKAISGYGNNLYLDNIKIIQIYDHDAGVSSLDPVQVYPLGTVSPKATITNSGENPESFNVTMTIGSYTSTKAITALASNASTVVTFDPWTNSLGDYTVQVCTQLGTDQNIANNCVSHALRVMVLNKDIYGYNAFPGSGTDPKGPTSFNTGSPGTLNSIADQSSLQFVNGGTWANGLWYGTVYNTSAPYEFITIDPVSGIRTVIGDMGMAMNGLSYNPSNGKMYAVTSTNLYTINIATGVPTLVGSNTGISMINLAINNAGACYSVDVSADVLGSVNLTTGLFTPIGSVGFNAQYAQDMEFDRETGELFMAAQDASSGWLAWVNKSTGSTLKIGDFEGGAEITGMAIPYTGGKTLVLSGIKLEGLYNGIANPMNQAADENGPHWPAGIADHITVELHSSSAYSTTVYTATDIPLSISGSVVVTIPSGLTGSYYITVKHRNSLETVSAVPVSFSGSTISRTFGAPSDVFGGNLMTFMDGGHAIFGGDTFQDGLIDGSDLSAIDNKASAFSAGYLAEDCNGDGLVDGSDLSIADNNASAFAGSATP